MDLDGIGYALHLKAERERILARVPAAQRARILGKRPAYYPTEKPAPKPRPVVAKPAPVKNKKQSPEVIIDAVLEVTGISRYEFMREGRCRDIVSRARQLGYWLVCRIWPDMSWPAKGRVFCKHHSSVMAGYWRVEDAKGEKPFSEWLQHRDLVDLVEAANKTGGVPPVSSWRRSIKDRQRPLKGRRRGEAHPEAKMTDAQVIAIRADARSSAVVAAAYGMSRSAIKDIRSRKNWRHI